MTHYFLRSPFTSVFVADFVPFLGFAVSAFVFALVDFPGIFLCSLFVRGVAGSAPRAEVKVR